MRMAIFSAFRKRLKSNHILKEDVSIISDISFYGYRPAFSGNYFTKAHLQTITFNCLMKIYIPMEANVLPHILPFYPLQRLFHFHFELVLLYEMPAVFSFGYSIVTGLPFP